MAADKAVFFSYAKTGDLDRDIQEKKKISISNSHKLSYAVRNCLTFTVCFSKYFFHKKKSLKEIAKNKM